LSTQADTSAAAGTPARAESAPALAFSVEDARALDHAAVPTLSFELRVEAPGVAIRSLMLNVQIQIAARRRAYDERAERRLAELFGAPERWGSTLGTLPWVRTTVAVPPFADAATVELPITCSYDLEVAASKYFNGLDGGKVPLEFLFSGSIFYADAAGRLQITRIPWESEAEFMLPVRAWKAAIERHFPGAAWLRLDRESFDRLHDYKVHNALPTWEAALDSLLESRQG
jgi:Family of unknown function (DUF6084)